MKKILLATIAMTFCSTLWAKEVKPNCGDVKVHLDMGIDDHFEVKAKWKTINTFPNPSETVEVGDNFNSINPSFSFVCPDFSASYDGEVIEIKSTDYQTLLSNVSLGFFSDDYRLKLFSYSWYLYPSIYEGRNSDSYAFNIRDFELVSGPFPIKEGAKLGSSHHKISDKAVVGYRVDDGALKPLVYEREISNYKQDLKNANTINIYHKNSDAGVKGEDIQRIFIDRKNGILRVYRNYVFPSS